jgi:hypothetical protein
MPLGIAPSRTAEESGAMQSALHPTACCPAGQSHLAEFSLSIVMIWLDPAIHAFKHPIMCESWVYIMTKRPNGTALRSVGCNAAWHCTFAHHRRRWCNAERIAPYGLLMSSSIESVTEEEIIEHDPPVGEHVPPDLSLVYQAFLRGRVDATRIDGLEQLVWRQVSFDPYNDIQEAIKTVVVNSAYLDAVALNFDLIPELTPSLVVSGQQNLRIIHVYPNSCICSTRSEDGLA